ncbi:Eco57I restriction-modification methylase domain-containing protein [Lutibacter flavus]|uniref:site-specific DNA-methyltransferase (adenine-specific) n=1 Tax=Lutibacter flavus TaxID=691689 RepID=A0A238YDJ2_9FLAO|nr:Eco57I restriction-modification methylase domain-containing protein [Lutibacter flavus]SNR68673.1 adenine-specific DNA-methyltransferase [Lutibacter flavus]
MNKKSIGSYYTPLNLAKFIAEYCLSQIDKPNISVLEPSVGDGNFVQAINEIERLDNFNKISLTIVEREKAELNKAVKKNNNKSIKITALNKDYLDFHFLSKKKFSAILGNPPYVKSNYLTSEQKKIAKEIHLEQNLADRKINNIWTSFLVSGISKLQKDGLLAFVLPLELLQVKFTEEIRDLLKNSFKRIEIFMFDELQFLECKGQNTVLLIGYKEHEVPGTFYTTIKSIEELQKRKFRLYSNKSVSESNKKWTHHFITPEEHSFLENIKKELRLVSDYVDNKAGIVTAANNFFIVDKETLDKYDLKEYAKPIVQKGVFVNGSVTFSKYDYLKLIKDNKPSYLLDFNVLDIDNIPSNVNEYILFGEAEKLQNRFKCKQRNNWYQVPNISKQSQAFFFKRAHEYPKLLKNEANVFVTDSAYKIEIKDNYNLNDFIFSFYNSLTLTFAELEGRYYGGGVLELTPNEFRVLPMPMSSHNNFNAYKIDFKSKQDIEEILLKYNHQILNNSLNLSSEEINRIELIRKKLVNKRHRK